VKNKEMSRRNADFPFLLTGLVRCVVVGILIVERMPIRISKDIVSKELTGALQNSKGGRMLRNE